MPTMIVDYDDHEETEDVDYPDMDALIVGAMARSGDQGAIDFLNSDHDVDDAEKAVAQSLVDELHDLIVEHYAPLIANGMQSGVSGIDEAINAARKG